MRREGALLAVWGLPPFFACCTRVLECRHLYTCLCLPAPPVSLLMPPCCPSVFTSEQPVLFATNCTFPSSLPFSLQHSLPKLLSQDLPFLFPFRAERTRGLSWGLGEEADYGLS